MKKRVIAVHDPLGDGVRDDLAVATGSQISPLNYLHPDFVNIDQALRKRCRERIAQTCDGRVGLLDERIPENIAC
jgi:hypothetical protein